MREHPQRAWRAEICLSWSETNRLHPWVNELSFFSRYETKETAKIRRSIRAHFYSGFVHRWTLDGRSVGLCMELHGLI